MNPSIQSSQTNNRPLTKPGISETPAESFTGRQRCAPFRLAGLLLALVVLWGSAPAARADRVPLNCSGSGLGITLFTSAPDVHVGDTLRYSVNIFNGIAGTGRISDHLDEREYQLVLRAVQRYPRRLDEAARELGVSRTTLWRRMRKYDIRLPGAADDDGESS